MPLLLMAETTPKPEAAPAPPPAPTGPGVPGWSQLWQTPVLLVGLLLFGAWLWMTVSAPKPHNDFPGGLDSIAQYLKANNFDQARESINNILPHIGQAAPLEKARLSQLWGDLVYLEQRSTGADAAENHRKVVELYTQAREGGQPFDATHLQWWADTLVALGQEDKALKMLDELRKEPAETRYRVVREIIERKSRQPGVTPQVLAPLISRFQDEVSGASKAQRREQDIWLTGLESRMALDSGAPDKAIDGLLRRLATLTAGGDDDLGPLYLLLAKGYQRTDIARARPWFVKAKQKLPPSDPLSAEILVGLGQLDLAETNDVRSALDSFTNALTQFSPQSGVYFDATVGRADCEARLGQVADAVDHFRKAVKYLLDQPSMNEAREKQVYDTIHTHYDAAMEREDYDHALDYLSALPPLYGKLQELPAKLLLEMGTTYEKLADRDRAEWNAGNGAEPGGAATQPAAESIEERAAKLSGKVDAVAQAKPDKQQGEAATEPAEAEVDQARTKLLPHQLAAQRMVVHLGKAAEYYLRHAHAVAVADEAAYSASLWKAADCFDKAQMWKRAIDVYAEFVKNRIGDPKRLDALVRLGLAYEADGQYPTAIERFQQVIDTEPRSPEAYAALVPLARCHIARGDFSSAKRVLTYVVQNHPTITPESNVYRDALIELGKLHYRLGEFPEAIERLALAADRYKDAPDIALIRFRLADAYRRSIEAIDKDLTEPMPQSRKLELQRERTRRLEAAQALFTQVVNEYELRDETTLGPVELLSFRNAYFYRADCAYDLRQFKQSIDLYEVAAKRWEAHPASLVALVQIVNAYCEMGMVQEAKVANLRARALLKRIPEEAFNDPSLPMSRDHWADWLDWTSKLDLFSGKTASAAP
jgi:tetratricopeptide (TPR) repeat protein